MAYKILGALVTNPANNIIVSATSVACNIETAGVVEVQGLGLNGATWESKGTIKLPIGIHKINKDAAYSITFTGQATKIAHSD